MLGGGEGVELSHLYSIKNFFSSLKVFGGVSRRGRSGGGEGRELTLGIFL
jgi:hypothetical protein